MNRSDKKIYLDCAATTPMASEVINAMRPYFNEKFGNPGSLHFFGQEAIKAVDESREKIAKAIGTKFNEIIFAGSATEANNLALRGIVKNFNISRAVAFQNQNNFAPAAKFSSPSARQSRFAGTELAAPAECSSRQSALDKNFSPLRIIISAIEHESIWETARDLEREGVEVIYLPVDKNGFIDLKKLESSLNERTILVSIMYANNEIGTVQPIQKISKIIKDFKGKRSGLREEFFFAQYPLLHTDAVQAFQFLDCDANRLGVDLMTLSAHKIYGPKGIGLLYVRDLKPNTQNLKPIIAGGGQEFGLRSGTENVASIVGFAKAIELADKNRRKESKRVAELTDYFWKNIKKISPKAKLNGDSPKIPNILNIDFPEKNNDLLIKLDIRGLAVSSGSACKARALEPSRVLRAIGLSDKQIKNSVRFSFGRFTTKKEIIETLNILKKTI